jgi:hypothetical protein
MPAGLVDPQALAALNAAFAQRLQALWSAVQAASLTAPSVSAPDSAAARVPMIAKSLPGDRRFAAREWDELPYFALLKQSYLLASEYAAELAALVPLPEPDKRRLAFLTRQAIDALAPTNFPGTNPEAIRRALATDGGSLVHGLANLIEDTRKGRISMTDERAFLVG